MAAINLAAINGSVYIRQEPERISGGRRIHRFVLENSSSQQVVDSAATAITSFLRDNPQLSFVSRPTEPETLQHKISSCRYLIINGNALCLSNKTKAPGAIDILCKDMFFSEAVIDEPVQCSRGRTFEKRYVEVWAGLRENICPCSNHEIGPIEIDFYLLERINSIVTAHENQARINREATERMQKAEEDRLIQNARITTIQASIKPNRTLELTGGGSKITGKAAIFLAVKVADVAAESTAHTVLKKIPFVSLIFGVILASYRCYDAYKSGHNKAQYCKAVAELASGVAGCFPGYGTAIAIGLDVAMGGHDVYEITNGKVNVNINVENAHKTLGLDPSQIATKQQVDKAFREMSRLTHPDRMNTFGEYNQQELNDLQVMVTTCKDLLYGHYGYTG